MPASRGNCGIRGRLGAPAGADLRGGKRANRDGRRPGARGQGRSAGQGGGGKLPQRSDPRRAVCASEARLLRRGLRGDVPAEAGPAGGPELGLRPVGARSAGSAGVLHQGTGRGAAKDRLSRRPDLVPDRRRAGRAADPTALEGPLYRPFGGRALDRLHALRPASPFQRALPPGARLPGAERRSGLPRAGRAPRGLPADEADHVSLALAAEIRPAAVDRGPHEARGRPADRRQDRGDLHRRGLRPAHDASFGGRCPRRVSRW